MNLKASQITKSIKNDVFRKFKISELLKSGLLVFLVLLVGKSIQFLKELMVAKEIGAAAELDGYLIAFLIITLFTVFIFHPLAYTFIPVFIRLRKYSPLKANIFFSKLLALAIVLGVVGYFIQTILVSNFLTYVVSDVKEIDIHQIRQFYFLLTPFYIFTIGNYLFGAYLNALNKNILYTIYPAFPALFTIVCFLVITKIQPIYLLILGFNLGSFIALCALIYACKKNGFFFKFNSKLDKPIKVCLQQWLPLILASFLFSINLVVDKYMVIGMEEGSLSHLEYGNKLFFMFSEFSITGLSTILFPFYSEKVAQKDFRGILTFSKRFIFIIIGPLLLGTFLVLLGAEQIVSVLFERGAFTSKDTEVVSEIMGLYLLGFPFITISIIGVRILNALQFNMAMTYFNVFNILFNIGLNIVFINWYGLKGIALATSAVYMVNCLLIWGAVGWYYKHKGLLSEGK